MSSQYEVLPGRLTGKVILIVGATSGIGRAVALRVAGERATVIVAGRRAELGAQVCDDIMSIGGQAVFTPCDATQEGDVAAAVALAVDKFGHLDGAVNNAGGVLAAGPLADLSAADWQAELDLNLNSVFFGLKHQIPAIHASGGGAIINNASTAGVSAVPGLAAYSAAKHGLVGLTKSAALEWADRRVRVNAIVTGNVDTPSTDGSSTPPLTSRATNWMHPTRLAGSPTRPKSPGWSATSSAMRPRSSPAQPSRSMEGPLPNEPAPQDRMTFKRSQEVRLTGHGSELGTICGLGDRTFRKGMAEWVQSLIDSLPSRLSSSRWSSVAWSTSGGWPSVRRHREGQPI